MGPGPGGYWKAPPDTHVESKTPSDPPATPPCDVVGCYEPAVLRAASTDDAIEGEFVYCADCGERQLERFGDLTLLPELPGSTAADTDD